MRLIPLYVCLSFMLAIALALAQDAAPPAGAPPAAPPPGGPGVGPSNPAPGVPGGVDRAPGMPGRGTDPGIGRQPRPMDPNEGRYPDLQRQIFLSGKVMMEDGTPPPEPVRIERVCNGIARPEAYTDSKGRFSFALGQNNLTLMDASDSSVGDPSFGAGPPGFPGPSRNPGMGSRGGFGDAGLMGCELRASLPGFRSDVINLSGRRAMDNPDVGVIILRRMAKVEGFTFSATTAFAPKEARKAYEKAREAVRKKKFEEAERELTKAVTVYPKFAVAWYELGLLHQQNNKLEEARKAHNQALEADAKFVSPYVQLARLAAFENKWPEVAQYTSQALKLNPYLSPETYFYSAIAALNLRKLELAEEHAREAAKMDPQHRIPKIHHLLGVILAQRHDLNGAAEQMRLYLKFAPNAADAAMVRTQISELEKMTSAQGAATAAPTPQE